MIRTGTNDPDLDAVFGIPLKRSEWCKPMQLEHRTYTSKTIEDVDIVTRIQIVNGTLAVDLERV
jgi:hypothetical protein